MVWIIAHTTNFFRDGDFRLEYNADWDETPIRCQNRISQLLLLFHPAFAR